jgi:hypothetical protein
MAISFVGAADATGETVALPTHQAGDLIFIYAPRDGNNTPPSLPAGYTTILSGGSSQVVSRTGYKIAASGSETSGTWTNATHVHALVLRGVNQSDPIGASAATVRTSDAFVRYLALTMEVTDGTSWVVACGLHRTATNVETPPGSMTNRTSEGAGPESALHDSNGGISSWSQVDVAVNQTAASRGTVVEILAGGSPVYLDLPSAVTLELTMGDALGVVTTSNPSASRSHRLRRRTRRHY